MVKSFFLKIALLCAFVISFSFVPAQNNIVYNSTAVETLLTWMENGCPSTDVEMLLQQPGNQLMEDLIKNKENDLPSFRQALLKFQPNDSMPDAYMLDQLYKNRNAVSDLLNALKNTDFSEQLYQSVSVFFPEDYKPTTDYEVYFSATGWKWGDAMSFDYVKEGNQFHVANEGTPAIIINLTIVCRDYGSDPEQQMSNLKNVMAHELFHAILSDYTKTHWTSWDSENVNNAALLMIMNEGVAHYLSIKDYLISSYDDKDSSLKKIETKAFLSLADSSEVIFNTNLPDEKRVNALSTGCYGNFWDKYVCMSGMFMVYHIIETEGVESIKECVINGPLYFAEKYKHLQSTHNEWPALPKEILSLCK